MQLENDDAWRGGYPAGNPASRHIARLRADAARLLAEAGRLQAEEERRQIAWSARHDQTMAFVHDAMARADELLQARERTQHVAKSTSKSAWIIGQLIAYLKAEAPLPASTTYIVDKLCLRHEYPTVLRLLNQLAKRGDVEKWPSSSEHKACYWRWWGTDE
jgi:hypothetical protein